MCLGRLGWGLLSFFLDWFQLPSIFQLFAVPTSRLVVAVGANAGNTKSLFVLSCYCFLIKFLFLIMISLICIYLCLHSVPMCHGSMNDFMHDLNSNTTVNDLSIMSLATNNTMLLTPIALCDLTPFGINKVLFNKELPVVLQVIDIMDKSPPARKKVTLIELDGSTTFFC